MATKEERLKSLEERIARAKAEIRKIKAPAQKLNRKQETRKKIILGALLQTMLKNNIELQKDVERQLNNTLKRDAERKLFNLPPLENLPK